MFFSTPPTKCCFLYVVTRLCDRNGSPFENYLTVYYFNLSLIEIACEPLCEEVCQSRGIASSISVSFNLLSMLYNFEPAFGSCLNILCCFF